MQFPVLQFPSVESVKAALIALVLCMQIPFLLEVRTNVFGRNTFKNTIIKRRGRAGGKHREMVVFIKEQRMSISEIGH